jgi:hypothetical protein
LDGDGQLRFGEFLCAMHLAERRRLCFGLGKVERFVNGKNNGKLRMGYLYEWKTDIIVSF